MKSQSSPTRPFINPLNKYLIRFKYVLDKVIDVAGKEKDIGHCL